MIPFPRHHNIRYLSSMNWTCACFTFFLVSLRMSCLFSEQTLCLPWMTLEVKGYFLVGDLAYPLMGHLLVPCSDANLWLSNCRIQNECEFGEVVMQWGILWRKLLFDIKDVGKVLRAAVLLRNFLLDEQEFQCGCNIEDAKYFQTFSLGDLDDCSSLSSEPPSAVATDNNEPHPGGRPFVFLGVVSPSESCLYTPKSMYISIYLAFSISTALVVLRKFVCDIKTNKSI
jgi:hypothetical protein